MAWKIRLEGHEFDLRVLERELSGPHSVMEAANGKFVLSSVDFDGASDAGVVKAKADEIVRRINGSYCLSSASYQPIKATVSITHGTTHHAVVVPDTVTVRSSAGVAHVSVDGAPAESPQSPASRRVAVAASDPAVDEALEVMGEGDLDWPRLYKVYEIVKDDSGGTLDHLPAITVGEVKSFTASANRPDVSGEGARHARMSGGPPRITMTPEEGRKFIGRLVDAWVSTKP